MKLLPISAEVLVDSLLELSKTEQVCILDSGGISYLNSHLLIAGVKPLKSISINEENPARTFEIFNNEFINKDIAAIFSMSYDFGLKLENLKPIIKDHSTFSEPDIFASFFDCLIFHNYITKQTYLLGNQKRFDEIENLLTIQKTEKIPKLTDNSKIFSNFNREEYISAISKIKDYIRCGDTYQTNLTQQFRAKLPESLTAQIIFKRLLINNPASFSAFLKRTEDYVISTSPERFFKVDRKRIISTSPIKGTSPRGINEDEDQMLKNKLLTSEKDRAENVMIVDLLRNDIGRICKFGSVKVEKLCELETHPTLFHLVSTIRGELKDSISFADIIKAVFPCGSITGAPKIRTMKIIDEIETVNRGLSMGAIGYYIPSTVFKLQNVMDLNVAIRTMVISEQSAFFNVGGGIVIDSDPEDEYQESLLKAKALFNALNGKLY